jgi:hypothetical protein
MPLIYDSNKLEVAKKKWCLNKFGNLKKNKTGQFINEAGYH